MCGVVVAFHRQGLTHFRGNIDLSLELIRHRGPDQTGEWKNDFWYFGSTRLSITGGDGNRQPALTKDKRFVIAFNGEIYNFRMIREKLVAKGRSFDTVGDTEVILNSYLEWGDSCFRLFDGQFAIAILDVLENVIVIARDRFGEKPAYFQLTPESFVFSSEINPIIQLHNTPVRINRVSVLQYLSNWYVQEPNTIFQDIHVIPPNTFTKINTLSFSNYKQIFFTEIHKNVSAQEHKEISLKNAISNFEEHLTNAVCLVYPQSHVPALMLSGGLDSSLIACILKREGLPFEAFTTTVEGHAMDETNTVDEVSSILGISSTKIPITTPNGDTLRQIVSKTDIPIGEASFLGGFTSAQALQNSGYKVVLLGDGGDEILAGYPTYLASIISSQIPNVIKPLMKQIGNALNRLPLEIEHNGLTDKILRFLLFQNEDIMLSHLSWRSNYDFASMHRRKHLTMDSDMRQWEISKKYFAGRDSENLLMAIMKLDRKTWLGSSNLAKNDRAFMLHGIENRTPYLTNNLVDFLDSLPNSLKIGGFKTKILSRELSKKYLGNLLSSDIKRGWSFPLKYWVNEIESDSQEVMKNSVLLRLYPELAEVFYGPQTGIRGSYRFKWAMLTLEYWLQTRPYPIH